MRVGTALLSPQQSTRQSPAPLSIQDAEKIKLLNLGQQLVPHLECEEVLILIPAASHKITSQQNPINRKKPRWAGVFFFVFALISAVI